MNLTEKDIARFWSKVDRRGEDECWEWQAARQSKGYGHIGIGGAKGRNELAHRISYTLTYGEIPDGLDVCHRCDNPGCANPNHLFTGTASENGLDMVAKGRQHNSPLPGETNGNHKLTSEEVKAIRSRYAIGNETQSALAKQYGVDPSQIGHIVNMQQWVCA